MTWMDRCIMQFAWVSSSEISKWALLLTEQTTHTYLTSPCLPAPPDLCPSAERERVRVRTLHLLTFTIHCVMFM